jgi:hypothetical protein
MRRLVIVSWLLRLCLDAPEPCGGSGSRQSPRWLLFTPAASRQRDSPVLFASCFERHAIPRADLL